MPTPTPDSFSDLLKGLGGAVIAVFGVRWNEGRKERLAQAEKNRENNTTVQVRLIEAETSREKTVLDSMSTQIANLMKQVEVLQTSYDKLSAKFEEEREKRQKWEDVAAANHREIENLNAKLVKIETDEIKTLNDRIVILTEENRRLKAQLDDFNLIGSREKP